MTTTFLGMTRTLYESTLITNLIDVKTRTWLRNNYVPTDNEVWVVTYPKCGTTLTIHLCHEIMHCVYKKTKSEKHAYYAKQDGQYSFSHWLEVLASKSMTDLKRYQAATRDTIRFYKTHSKYEYLPCKRLPRKMIVVTRNPKANIVSFYHHIKNYKKAQYQHSFDTFFMVWIAGLMISNSYFDYYKTWWNVYKKSQQQQTDTDILWLYYEDMVISDESKKQQILKLIDFLGVSDIVNAEEDIEQIMQNTSVNVMKKQYESAVVKDFVRKGQIGEWKEYLSAEQNEIIDAMIRVHFNDATDMRYYNDLQTKKDYLCKL